ncbi:MAG: flippase-like domain-containing protein [Verrucomicrobiota bacterium]|nr:flippase-like domain-containing protein [Verrucomicrobiota bacterium]
MKKILLTLLQLVVTVAVLYWVFHDPEKRAKMLVALRAADYRWIGGAMVAYMMVEISAAIRWHILLKVQKISLSLRRVSALFLIGMFFNQFLPGGTGGDIVKSYLLVKETPGKITGALLAVLFDRIIGLVALCSITGVLIGLRYDFLAQTPQTRNLLWILLAILSFAIVSLLSTFVISGFNLLHRLPAKFPGREKLIELSAAYHLYAHHWMATLAAFGCSLVAHLATFLTFLCVAYAFGVVVPVIDFFSIMPIERTISSLPISFAGVGLREKVLQVMLNGLCDVEPAKAVLIGSMSFLVMLACAAPGGLVYLFYRPSGATGPVKLREMREEVATLEHHIAAEEE